MLIQREMKVLIAPLVLRTPNSFYGGSEGNDIWVAWGVAQTNIGYNYIGKTLEILNIEPGSLYERHAKAMDKKFFYDKQRKAKKEIQEKA